MAKAEISARISDTSNLRDGGSRLNARVGGLPTQREERFYRVLETIAAKAPLAASRRSDRAPADGSAGVGTALPPASMKTNSAWRSPLRFERASNSPFVSILPYDHIAAIHRRRR